MPANTVRIIRLETPTGTGMYGTDWQPEPDYNRHPLPQNDDRLMRNGWAALGWSEKGEHYFGFSSRAQCLAWLYDSEWWLHPGRNCGLVVSIYEVDREFAILGDTQAVFLRSEARLVRRWKLAEFYNMRDGVQDVNESTAGQGEPPEELLQQPSREALRWAEKFPLEEVAKKVQQAAERWVGTPGAERLRALQAVQRTTMRGKFSMPYELRLHGPRHLPDVPF